MHFSYMFFFFNDTATTEIYTLSLHDALPISIEKRFDPVTVGAALAVIPMIVRMTRMAVEDLGGRDLKGLREPHQVLKRQAPDPTLDGRDVCGRDLEHCCELALAQVTSVPQGTYALTDLRF